MKICCLVVYFLLRVELKIEIRLISLLESECKPVNEIHHIKCPPAFIILLEISTVSFPTGIPPEKPRASVFYQLEITKTIETNNT